MKLETGQITETQFDAQEKVLLDRLDRLQVEEQAAAEPEKKPRPKVKSRRRKSPPRGETGNHRLTDDGRPTPAR